MYVINAGDWPSCHTDDQVAFAKTRLRGRTVVLNRQHYYASLAGQIVKPYQSPVQRSSLRLDPNVAAPDSPIAQQPAGHEFRGIDPDREAEALRHHDGGGVYAYHAAVGSDERPTRIPGIERRIGLDHVVN